MARCVFVAFSNPVPGREDEFNRWYDEVHVTDWLKIPGVTCIQRFRRTDEQRSPGPHPWEYLAIYECDSKDMSKVIAVLKERSGTSVMPLTDALGPERYNCWYEAITPVRTP